MECKAAARAGDKFRSRCGRYLDVNVDDHIALVPLPRYATPCFLKCTELLFHFFTLLVHNTYSLLGSLHINMWL